MDLSHGTLLDGRIRYAQPIHGYRTGIEPVLLAASVPARPGESVLEAGTGAAAALLCLAHRVQGLQGTGIERDPAMAALARQNLAANATLFTILETDVTALPPLPPFDHVVANPPWHDPAATLPPDARRAAATHRGAGGLAAWIEALAPLAKATLTLILPATLAGEAITRLQTTPLASLTLIPLRPREAQPAKIVLIQASPGPAGSRIAPGLTLHNEGQGYTPETEAILRQGAAL